MKKRVAMLAMAALMSSGCVSAPDGGVTDAGGVEIVRQVMREWGDGLAPIKEEE